MAKNTRLVYSTDGGRVHQKENHPIDSHSSRFSSKGIRIERQTKGRKGKGVTLITGLTLDRKSMLELAKNLKRKCGTGGTLKAGVIEIQGDCRDKLLEELRRLGFDAKISGG